MSSPQFLATIYKIWMLRYVDVPEDVGLTIAKEYAAATKPAKRSGKKTLPKHIPVVATSNSRSTRTTLVPAGAGRYRLQANANGESAASRRIGEWAALLGMRRTQITEKCGEAGAATEKAFDRTEFLRERTAGAVAEFTEVI